jgi:aldehyde:ferredoxin oxidoreductase
MKSPGNPLVFSAGPLLRGGNPFLFSGRLVIGQRAPFCGETNRSCA